MPPRGDADIEARHLVLLDAGSGDVLTGIILGRVGAGGADVLLDQVAAAVYIHSRAADLAVVESEPDTTSGRVWANVGTKTAHRANGVAPARNPTVLKRILRRLSG